MSGLVKLLHPDGDPTREEVQEYLELALEGRRRVKEQLKKMGAFEYYQTSFSYFDTETMQEHFVGVPGGRRPAVDQPATRCRRAASTPPRSTEGDTVALHRIEVSRMAASGKLRITGSPDRAMKESIVTAFDYIRANKLRLGIERDLDSYDYHVQIVDLMQSKEGSQGGVAFFVRSTPCCGTSRSRPGWCPGRDDHPGQHPARALAGGAAAGDHGQRRQARARSPSAIDASISRCRRTSWSGWIRSSTRSRWPPR